MRFTILSAALIAATNCISGGAASDVATTTLTRTLQRVVETVTQTRASGAVATGTGMPSGYVNGSAIYTSPTVSAAAQQTGAAINVHANAAGLAAVAGIVGYLAL